MIEESRRQGQHRYLLNKLSESYLFSLILDVGYSGDFYETKKEKNVAMK